MPAIHLPLLASTGIRAVAVHFGGLARRYPSVPQGTGLVGDFARAAVIYVREQVRVDFSESATADSFAKNQVIFRAEGRFGVAAPRAALICKVTGL